MEEKKQVQSIEENIDLESKETETKPVNRKKTIGLVFLVILISIIVFVVIFNLNDFNETIDEMKKLNASYLGWAGLCIVLYLALWPLSLCLIAKVNKTKAKFIDSYLIGGSEHFFNAITPFSSGGQPIQGVLYYQDGVNAAESTGIIMANFIAFLIATNIFAVASLFYYGRFSVNFTDATRWMIILGFVMNLFTLFFIILMATCKAITNFFTKCLRGLSKIKYIGKYIEKGIPAFEKYCDNAQAAFKQIISHKWSFVGAVLLRGISLVFYYATPFYILKAMDLNVPFVELPFIMLASSFAITTMVWVPTPGGMGGIEFAFTTIFATFAGVTQSKALTGMVCWRFLTYYLLMILSFIMYVIFMIILKKRKKRNDQRIINRG